MAWLMLFAAGALEVVWAMALKYSNGFTRLAPSVLCLSAASVSFLLLSLALRTLPVGTAYAIWVGIGILGVAITGILYLAEPVSPQRMFFLCLILVGVIGLKVAEVRA